MTQALEVERVDRYKRSNYRTYNKKWVNKYDSIIWMKVFNVAAWDQRILAEFTEEELVSAKILDIGCATGRLLRRLAEGGMQNLCGADLAPKILDKAREKLEQYSINFELKQADAEDHLPWPDHHFDAVTMTGVVHHFLQPKSALKEISRVLAKSGRMMIIEPWFPVLLRSIANAYLCLFPTNGDCKFYGPSQLEKTIESAGFENITITTGCGRFSYMVIASE